jgi:hypothetical protein
VAVQIDEILVRDVTIDIQRPARAAADKSIRPFRQQGKTKPVLDRLLGD